VLQWDMCVCVAVFCARILQCTHTCMCVLLDGILQHNVIRTQYIVQHTVIHTHTSHCNTLPNNEIKNVFCVFQYRLYSNILGQCVAAEYVCVLQYVAVCTVCGILKTAFRVCILQYCTVSSRATVGERCDAGLLCVAVRCRALYVYAECHNM